MWQVSKDFKRAMRREVVEYRVKVQFLNTKFEPIFELISDQPNKALIDGVVDVDVSRGTRRTVTMSMLNEDGKFSPNGKWGGLWYLNRLIRVFRGVVVGPAGSDKVEWCPIGTFMVDKSETLVERKMSTVIISGSDLWKKLDKSQYLSSHTYKTDQHINTVIRDILDNAGVTKWNLDPLDERSNKTLDHKVVVEKGETRGEVLKKIAADNGLDVYFNPRGVFVSEDHKDPDYKDVVWELGNTDADSLVYLIRSVVSDDRLYNHVQVVATGDPNHTYKAEVKDNDPSSPTNIDKIGDRVYRKESGIIKTQAATDRAARKLFHTKRALAHDIAIEAMCNPAYEGDDIIRVVEKDFVDTRAKYRLTTFNVPLATSKQQMTLVKVIKLG